MDTVGAFFGPVIALTFLYFFPKQYTTIFYLAFIPGIISVMLVFLLREKKQPTSTLSHGNFFSFFRYWNIATSEYKKLILGLLMFALFNSSDIFLLLKTKQVTGNDSLTISAYIFYNLVYAVASYPLGILADKLGLRKVFITGLLLFGIVYAGFSFQPSTITVFILFFIYGIYAAASEGVSKAWITNIAHKTNTATAIGFFTSCQSICSLLASTVAGILWSIWGSSATFGITAFISTIVLFYFFFAFGVQKASVTAKK
jgi:MFS family permease